jgi:hypothetical protein
MTPQEEAVELRALILDALPKDTSPFGKLPALHEVFVPKSHVRALHPNTMLVVGARGEGKSFWWGTLQDPDHRALVKALRPETHIGRDTICVPGFGVPPNPPRYPKEDELLSLQQAGYATGDIWKTVIVFAVLLEVAKVVEGEARMPELRVWLEGGVAQEHEWAMRVRWVVDEPGLVDRLLYECDQELQRAGRHLIVLFDALDLCASDWVSLYEIVRSLLQTTLKFRSTKRIRSKVFLRSDQFDEQRLAGFPDASKLFSSRVELRWSSKELYSLVWQLLGNHPVNGALFRGLAEELTQVIRKENRRTVKEQPAPWMSVVPDVSAGATARELWAVPQVLQHDADQQAEVLHALTGPAMGANRRRGIPYRWLPNHLWDAHQRITPRPFLAALREAAMDTRERHPEHPLALHHQGIKAGIKTASAIRITEIQEDYDWLKALMKPLDGLVVPCSFMELEERWDEADSLAALNGGKARGLYRLLPVHLSDGAAGVVKDLEELGLFYRMRDGRENMPDVYRLGFGLKRMGGIRPAGRRV